MSTTNDQPPQRKLKGHLTLIPEDNSPITYRFNVALVGETAEEFANKAVSSEFAEAYKPKAQRLDSVEAEEDRFVMFCPTGGDCELARLRFQPCSTFSQALPLTRNKAQASNVIVALIFWRNSSVKDALSDFRTRTAEIAHLPHNCRPYTVLLGFTVDQEQEQALTAFVTSCWEKMSLKIVCDFRGEDTDEAISEALQSACDGNMVFQRSKGSIRMSSTGIKGGENKKCCTLQ